MSLEEVIIRYVPHFEETAAMALAREEALFTMAKEELRRTNSFSPIVGLYSFLRPSVILGYRQPISEIDVSYCDNNGIDVTMRKSGGGSVYLSSEEIQYFYILPYAYSRELLADINARIKDGLSDAGFSPQLKIINEYKVLRMDEKYSFVFDAQKSAIIYNGDPHNPKHILLHHGTILIDNKDYHHMVPALKASERQSLLLTTGNVWLRNKKEIAKQRLIQTLKKNLPFNTKVITRDFSQQEISLAERLHHEFYNNREEFSRGNKPYGICYIPGPDYDMDKYRIEEKEVVTV